MNRTFPGAVVRLLVALAALAGALLSSGAASSDKSPPKAPALTLEPTPTPKPNPAPSRELQRALVKTVDQLVAARRSGRKRLAASDDARRQKAAAEALAAAYHRASTRLAEPAKKAGATDLISALDRASSAYDRLAVAARRGNRAAYARARTEIAAAERRLPKAFSAALTA